MFYCISLIGKVWSHVLQDERKTLDRELARAKVSANRVAVVVANEWKDANDKVMPVKQWLEERRFLQVNVIFTLFFEPFIQGTALVTLFCQHTSVVGLSSFPIVTKF